MKVRLKFFGQLKDLTKKDGAELQLKADTTVGDLVWILGGRFPNIREHLKVVSFAVNSEYAPKETVLQDGDEVGVLPPISGGRDI